MKLIIHFRYGWRGRRLVLEGTGFDPASLAEEFGRQRKNGGTMSFHSAGRMHAVPADSIQLIEVIEND